MKLTKIMMFSSLIVSLNENLGSAGARLASMKNLYFSSTIFLVIDLLFVDKWQK